MPVTQVRRVWKIAGQDRALQLALAEELGLPPILAHLLLQRGIESAADAGEYLNAGLRHLSDPMLLSGMGEATARIAQARDRGEHIRVFGDYDVDGISATVVMHNGLKRFGIKQVSWGMPDRIEEGYGLSPEHVDRAKRDGVSLLITVDNGISALESAERAREIGVDLIVTDHHAVGDAMPHAVAIINPRLEPEDYPGRNLCGAGVAFKVATALNGSANDLDLTALGTVADLMPLTGENRAIVRLGLLHMAKHRRNGIACLATASGFPIEDVTAQRIGFQLGPRINAAGRLSDAGVGLRLLLSECPREAAQLARELNQANEDRRALERQIFEEAAEELDAFFTEAQRSIVLAKRGWHAGVIGIVAARVQQRYQRPTVLISLDERGSGRGSGRGIAGFDMVGALSNCQDHLIQFGGHRAAAGCAILEENVAAFKSAFEADALRQLGTDTPCDELVIDGLVSFGEIDFDLLHALAKLEPFGQKNPEPLFASMGVEVLPESVRVLKEQHLKLSLRQDGRIHDAIAFDMAGRYYAESLPKRIDIAFHPQINTFRGDQKVQLLLRDYRPCG